MQIPAYINLPIALPARPASPPFGRVLPRLIGLARHWLAERRTLAELERLDAATLRDIGMTKWEAQRQLRAERATMYRRLMEFRC